MLSLPSRTKLFLCLNPVDMRKSFDGLLGIVRNEFQQEPLDGHLFLFMNRRRDCLKAIFCNRQNRPDLAMLDSLTREIVPLFHPRRDVWENHFRFNGAIPEGAVSLHRRTLCVRKTWIGGRMPVLRQGTRGLVHYGTWEGDSWPRPLRGSPAGQAQCDHEAV